MRSQRILVLCPYPEGLAATQRFKYEPSIPFLRAHGYDVVVSPFMTRALYRIVYEPGHLVGKLAWSLVGYARRVFDLLRMPLYDGVYVSLHVTPLGTSLFERLTRLLARRLVYDLDDLLWLGRTSPQNRVIAPFKGRSKSVYLLRVADQVLACSASLEALALDKNPRTTWISPTIRTDELRPGSRPRASAKLTIGWTGSHTTSPYLRLLERVFAELWRRHDWKLLVIGDPRFRLEGRDVEVIPWSPEREGDDLRRIDIGVCPLPERDPWVQGKSGLKALQYMAVGIPVVAAAAGAYPTTVEDGVTGYLARTEREWVDALERLLLDPALRASMGERGRERVERSYSVAATAPRYLEVFEKAFS